MDDIVERLKESRDQLRLGVGFADLHAMDVMADAISEIEQLRKLSRDLYECTALDSDSCYRQAQTHKQKNPWLEDDE